MQFMLDTNTCIHLIKFRPEGMRARLSEVPVGQVALSSIVVTELWYGVAHSQRREQNEAALRDFLDYVIVLDWPKESGPVYGYIRSHLRGKGTPIGAMDLLIAAHALHLNSILVTDNVREFERVPGLRIENWVGR